ncbi:hypothetical protein BU26DRAFT_165681 [Trematosphaeria pertusa]|uniref:Secreted protein n=1 Tax=Trematosphaeria pertusa TaxID=390896 RepID=A0A6A6HVF8_9PLEO|nr:uncharacterized protein BU26DRAFT_165681 [Trematosphaeria pertusa]KAF2242086.1 hypothetical protein BU26DRAFT_165681 [Trematosphaeria pertusa]
MSFSCWMFLVSLDACGYCRRTTLGPLFAPVTYLSQPDLHRLNTPARYLLVKMIPRAAPWTFLIQLSTPGRHSELVTQQALVLPSSAIPLHPMYLLSNVL